MRYNIISILQHRLESDLSVKRIVMELIGAVELLIMSLVHGDHVLISLEYLNLN